MHDRARRIVESAVELAEQGGFEAVRLRDVAARSGVALGTLYTCFRSKEDILISALEREMGSLVHLMELYPAQGETPGERVGHFFGTASRALFVRPNLARAVLRAVASGEPQLAERIARFHGGLTVLIVQALKGAEAPETEDPTTAEHELGFLLQQVWFASLVGWMGGLHDEEAVSRQMASATTLILRGFYASEEA